MSLALRNVEWDVCVLEPRHDRALESYVRRELGTVPSCVPYFTVSPWVVRSMTALSYFGAPLLHIDYVLADLIGLVVSQDNSCRYCYGAQRMLMRVHGLPEKRIREIEQDFLEAEIDPRTKAALDFARRISRAAPLVSASDLSTMRAAGWSVEAIREIAFQAVYNVYMNRLMTVPAIPVASVERLAERRALKWIAPVIRVLMRRRWNRARRTPLPPDRHGGPWEYLVRALADLPCGRELRTVLDEAWDSPLLSKRAKALVFAVVARGIDCPLAEREATRLLVETGVTPEQIEPILMHLGSLDLDPLERALVPFARRTIRGRPIQLQQRARELLEHLQPEQIVEAIGLSALANAVSRLDVVTRLG